MNDENIINSLLKGTTGVLHTEDILVEAAKDLVKDEIKRYIREKIESKPELKEEIKGAVGDFIEAKMKEAQALVKIAKSGAKLGLELVPEHLREEMAKELLSVFEKEINAVLEKTI